MQLGLNRPPSQTLAQPLGHRDGQKPITLKILYLARQLRKPKLSASARRPSKSTRLTWRSSGGGDPCYGCEHSATWDE